MTARTARPSIVSQLFKLALFAAVVFGLIRAAGLYFFAWDNGWGGRPTITGTWVGRVNTATQGPRVLLMELHRVTTRRGKLSWTGANIAGTGLLCDGRGREERYRISGTPGDRHASTVAFGAMPDVKIPPDGLELSSMRGTWNAADALTLQAQFHWRRGTSAITTSNDPDNLDRALPMRRGTAADYAAACRALVSR